MDDQVALTADDIKAILDLIESSGWDEARIEIGDFKLSLSNTGGTASGVTAGLPDAPVREPVAAAASAAATVPAPEAAAAPGTPTGSVPGIAVPSLTTGVMWRSPEPGAPPFVEVGTVVTAGTNLCIVEVMKLMNYVTAPVDGTVVAIHVGNGESVEKGTPLMTIDPAA